MRENAEHRDRGAALPSYVTIAAVVLVVVAAVVLFFVNRGNGSADSADPNAPITAPAETSSAETSTGQDPEQPNDGSPSTSTGSESAVPETSSTAEDSTQLGVYVWNTTKITGLAKRVGDYAAGLGWTFLGSDNWTSTVPPETTLYYPVGKKSQADKLSSDLGIPRQAIADDSGVATDRLTIVLTGTLPTVQ